MVVNNIYKAHLLCFSQ